jgi:hypothetical protein
MLLRALRDNPIEKLYCSNCGIESIEIDNDYIPRNVKFTYMATESMLMDAVNW